MGYFPNVIKGVSWLGAFRIITRVIAFIRIAILARLLTPSQFGVFGIATIVLALTDLLTETGINVFLVQEKERLEKYINTAWIVSILRGIIISLFMVIVAPLVGFFFNNTDAVYLILLASLIPFIRGFINPAVVRFQKELQFDKEFYLRLIIFIIDTVVVVTIAWVSRSTASFIWGMIISVFFEVVISFLFIKPVPQVTFDKEQFREILSKGKFITLSGIFNYLFHHIDDIVIGKLLGTSMLGIYDLAYKIAIIPITEATDVLSKVTFPIYVRISGDIDRLKRAYIKSLIFLLCIVIPVGLILYLFPRQIVDVFLGDQWKDVATIMPVLALFGVVRALSNSTSSVFLGLKQQRITATISFLSFVILAIVIVPFVLNYGLIGAAWAVLLTSFIILPVSFYFLFKLLK